MANQIAAPEASGLIAVVKVYEGTRSLCALNRRKNVCQAVPDIRPCLHFLKLCFMIFPFEGFDGGEKYVLYEIQSLEAKCIGFSQYALF